MILTVFRDPDTRITDLYNQPVLLHDVLIVGTLISVIPPVIHPTQITADVHMDPDLPKEILSLCQTKPLHVRKLRTDRQFAQDWHRYRFQLATSLEESIRLEYAGDEISHDID